MGLDQPPSSPNTSPNDPFNALQHANTENTALQGSQVDELLLDPSAPSQGTSMYTELPNVYGFLRPSDQASIHHALHGSVPRGNRAPAAL